MSTSLVVHTPFGKRHQAIAKGTLDTLATLLKQPYTIRNQSTQEGYSGDTIETLELGFNDNSTVQIRVTTSKASS